MNKKNMDKILPIQMDRNKSKDKKQESNFTLSDMLQVNPIANKTLTSKKRTDKIPPLSNDKIKNLQVTTKNPQKYVSYKQECFHRLNRESKLKDNERFAELLTRKSTDKIKPISAKNVKETSKEIDTSSKQLAQLNSILDAQKKISKKNVYTTKNCPTLKKTPSAKMKHICSSALYSDDVQDVDSMMKYFDKHMNMDTNETSLMKPKTPELLKKKTSKTPPVDNSLETFNARLKNKYFNKVYERNKFNTALKRPNFRSIQELLKINKNDFTTIEASMGKKENLDLALEDFINDEESDESDEKVNNEDKDILKNHRFYDYLEDLNKEEEQTSNGSITETSKQELYADINKIINKYRPQKEKRIRKTETATNSIAVDTNDNNNISKLRHSIMKSDYLMKEFNMAPVKQTKASNRPATSSKLSEDLEYLLK